MHCLIKLNDIEAISKKTNSVYKTLNSQKIEQLKKKIMTFFKSLGPSLVNSNDLEAINR